MKYGDVSQIFIDKQRTFDSLKRVVLSLSDPQLTCRIVEGQWTIAEIIEHLTLVESRLFRLLNISSQKLQRAGSTASSSMGLNIEIPDGVERNDRFKVRTREAYEPTGKAPAADSLTRLQAIHDDLLALRPLLQRIDLSAASFDHWLMGSLTLGQWLAFIGIHEQRHLSQIQSILASATFPKQ